MKTKNAIMKWLYVFTTLSVISFTSIGQTNIGGVINTYAKVTGFPSSCSCPSTNCASASVVSASGFAANDFVLIIQMKGARADSSNTSSHGNILNLYDAGNYEFDTIASVSGNTITFKVPLKQTYFTNAGSADSAYVQLVKVPIYSGNVNVTSTLTPQTWSASTGTGGVLAFVINGTLTLQANISADGRGFGGAPRAQASIGCEYDTAFYYQSTGWQHTACTGCGYQYAENRRVGLAAFGGCGSPCTTNRMHTNDSRTNGFRGEGIAANTFKKTFSNGNVAWYNKGKGRWGNGGGGGGNHNAGGGGGGNYGAGGYGGKMYNTPSTECPVSSFDSRRGLGGTSLTPTGSKIFMGGGGGEGHDNGGNGNTGTAGGGIIIIQAANIANNGSFTISANGSDNTAVSAGDGAGGGGAGGTILMDVSAAAFINPVTISAKGGKGGDHNNNNCHGTGGGGGGGVVWFSASGGSIPANVTTNVAGGANGTQIAATIDCGDVNWGATAGTAGGVLTGLASGASTFLNISDCSSSLPVELVAFRADVIDDNVELSWTTGSEYNSDYFTVERSEDGRQFSQILQKDAAGNSSSTRHYSSVDEYPLFGLSYYRLSQTNFDGHVHYSQVISVTINKTPVLAVYPNPSSNYFTVSWEGITNFNFVVTDVAGNNMIEEKNITGVAKVNAQNFERGIYYVKAYSGKTMFVKKIVIM